MSLKEKVISLIQLKQEGEYWDFKRQWHSKKTNLLHDIICMANNISDKDGYIIIGVDEEQDYITIDISSDSNRRKTQDVVCFLRDKKFAGGIRPTVYVETIELCGNQIDVLIIRNDNKTPYYLIENFEGVRANSIYSRIMDTNTPIDKSADINIIEKLWKKRFGIDKSAIEKIQLYLSKPSDWDDADWGGKYYKYDPAFTIALDFESDRNGYEVYHFNQIDKRPSWYDINIMYGQTRIISFAGIGLDGGRYFTCAPEISGFGFANRHSWDITYHCYVMGTLRYLMHEFYYNGGRIDDERIARSKYLELILIFDSVQEQKEFNDYARENYSQYDQDDYVERLPYFPNLEGYDMSFFKRQYLNTLILQDLFREFKNSN